MPAQPRLQTEPDPAGAPETLPDFDRAVHIADRPGKEFESLRGSGISAHTVVAMSFMPIVCLGVVVHLTLTRSFGLPFAVSLLFCTALTAAALALAFAHVLRPGDAWEDFASQTRTDTRYRVRAVIPRNRRTRRLAGWAHRITGRVPSALPGDASELDSELGGFEPVIVRPWLGVARPRAHWNAAGVLAALTLSGLAFMHWHDGTFGAMFSTPRIWAYAGVTGAVALGGAELLFPVYLRLCPGRLEVLRYPPFGGAPAVTTFDLRAVGLCVDFDTAMVAIEPPRPPGTPVPPTVLSDRWPYHPRHPDGHRPFYVCVALCPERSEFCRRLVQAALTETPAPPLPHDGLTG